MSKIITKKFSAYGIIAFNILTIIVFLFIAFKIIPYTYISGGRLENYSSALQTSILSILLLSFGIPVIGFAVKIFDSRKIFFRIWLIFGIGLIVVNIIFKSFMGIVIIAFEIPLVISASRLIVVKHSSVFIKLYLWFFFVFSCFNTILNLSGKSMFERVFMTIITVLQALLFLRLAVGKKDIHQQEEINAEI